MKDWLVFVAVIAIVALSLYLAFFAPCDIHRYSLTKDIPARCLKYFTGGQ